MSTNNLYDLYLDSVVTLARTIVIKSEDTAEALNNGVTQRYGSSAVDSFDPASWRYYKNVAGEYHFADTEMTVVSLDTLETIVFNKANLVVHRATAKAYQYGTRQYEELWTRYPSQELLILGILYPADLQTAVAAPNGTILSWPRHLVEPNEYSLMERLQHWVLGYYDRYVNMQFAISDDLYVTSVLGVMYAALPATILNLRQRACKTIEAHSFHVRHYLLSHGIDPYYLDNLTLKQTMFLYRNINYIERYAGQAATFEWLVEHIMTERTVPLAEYTMRHDVAEMPNTLSPELVFRRKPVNLGYSVDTVDRISLDEMLLKEDRLAKWNTEERFYETENIDATMSYSLSNVLMTKALESSMVDYTDNLPYTLSDVLMANWLWLSSIGYYNAVVSYTSPRTGERAPLPAKDAYCLMFYAWCASMDIFLDEIPLLYAKRVPRIPTPGIDVLMSVVNPALVKPAMAQYALDLHPLVTPVVSIEAFKELANALHRGANQQRRLCSAYQHLDARGQVHGMISQLYSDNTCAVAPEGTLYADWLTERNIVLDGFTRGDYELLYRGLIAEATGLTQNGNQTVRDVQAAMVGLVKYLSSYSIQFIRNINASNIVTGDNPMVRLGNIQGELSDSQFIGELTVGPMDARAKQLSAVEIDIGTVETTAEAGGFTNHVHWELPDLITTSSIRPRWRSKVDIGRVRFTSPTPIPQQDPEITPVPGIPEYLLLTPEQQAQFKDVYGNRVGG